MHSLSIRPIIVFFLLNLIKSHSAQNFNPPALNVAPPQHLSILNSDIQLLNTPQFEIRRLPNSLPHSDTQAEVPPILILDRGSVAPAPAEPVDFGGTISHVPATSVKVFSGTERDFQPSFVHDKYREIYPEPEEKPLVIDWNKFAFHTIGNYDLLRDDETGLLVLYATGSLARDVRVQSPQQLGAFLRAELDKKPTNERRKREVAEVAASPPTEFMHYYLESYLKLIIFRLSKDGVLTEAPNRTALDEVIPAAIEATFRRSQLFQALWSDEETGDSSGAGTVFNNIDWWSERVELADGLRLPLVDLILGHLFRAPILWMCEQHHIRTAQSIEQLLELGLDVLRTGPIYRVLVDEDKTADRTAIELLEQCNWWRRKGRLQNGEWQPIGD